MATPLIHYHPIRYEHYLRDLINFVVSRYESAPKEEHEKHGGFLFGTIFENELAEILKDSPYKVPGGQDVEDWLEYKEDLFRANASHFSDGENIFHIQPDLLEMFRNTDVSEIQVETLRAPYDHIYLYFGDTQDFRLDSNTYVDGAYVSYKESWEVVFVYLTTRNVSFPSAGEEESEVGFILAEPHLSYLLIGHEDGRTVGENLKDNIDERCYEAGVCVNFPLWEPHIKPVANIIINALCFMTSDHNDSVLRFPDSTPKGFVQKYAQAGSEKNKRKAISKAESHGFRRINFLGDTYRGLVRDYAKGQGDVPPHWRRGHWRNQAHGSGRSLHKLLWIKPTIVNRAKGEPLVSHIYDVEDKSQHSSA
jgi:hypothetical protein